MADPRALALDALIEVERGDRRAREAVEARRGEIADPRDRALLTEIVYGAVRRRGTIDTLLAAASKTALARLDPVVRAAMRAALAQALFLDRVPASAAVDAAVDAVKARTNPRYAGFANAVLRGVLRTVEGEASGPEDARRDVPREGRAALRLVRPVFADPAADPAQNLAERFAHPAWLVRRWTARHGERIARAICEAGAARAPISLRAPPSRREALLDELLAAGVPARAGEGPDEVVVKGGEAAALKPVKEGRAAVQDGTSQRVAPLLALHPGDRVLDLCAAPGGKTAHVLDLLQSRGEVVACDVEEEKVAGLARLLSARAAAGDAAAAASRAALVTKEGAIPFAPASFHAVLVDAPCSNTGVLRRRLEVRDRLREGDVARLAAIQRALLDRALPLLRPGGRLVYSTCSIEPEENEAVVAAVAAAHVDVEVLPGFAVLPTADHDGGSAFVFIARA